MLVGWIETDERARHKPMYGRRWRLRRRRLRRRKVGIAAGRECRREWRGGRDQLPPRHLASLLQDLPMALYGARRRPRAEVFFKRTGTGFFSRPLCVKACCADAGSFNKRVLLGDARRTVEGVQARSPSRGFSQGTAAS